jgi:HEAT repeat protein
VETLVSKGAGTLGMVSVLVAASGRFRISHVAGACLITRIMKMYKNRCFTIHVAFFAAAVAIAASPLSSEDDKSAGDKRQRQLISVLQSDAPPQEKAITCKRLAIYGNAKAVPALAVLLSDEKLASWARIALEAIPDPAADDALRQAMEKLNGKLLVGVINSIGTRRDAKAVDALVRRIKDADAEVASAAAAALGQIGNASAAQALEKSLTDTPAPVRSAVAEGCVLCAERLLAEGKANEAMKLYDNVRKADVPKQRILEATRGAILARQSAGVPLLVEQLRSADQSLFAIGLSTARDLSGREVTHALIAELGRTTPDRQALLILAMADRGDTAALPAVLQAAKSGPKQVRIVAIGVLQRLGDSSCVPTLLGIALEADAELAQTAEAALEGLAGEGVDADLVARLHQSEGKTRQLVIQLVGRRRIDAVPALVEAADDSDGQIRSAALTALGSTIGPDNLSILITRVAAPKHAEDTQAAEKALLAACVRMPDHEACAEKLTAALSTAPVSAKCTLLEILGTMGGAKALGTVAAAAKDANPELQETGTQLLGKWTTVDAAPVLLDLAKTAPATKYKIRTLCGYIRIARESPMPNEERAKMCRAALQAAERDTERKLVLEVLKRYPNIDMLKIAVEATKIPSLKNDAAAVSLVIAKKIGGESVDVQKLVAQVDHDPVKVEIIKADYGADAVFKDVTGVLRQHVRDFPVIVLPSSSYNVSLGGDPVPGTPKQLRIRYRINGKTGEVSFPENATIVLPIPE